MVPGPDKRPAVLCEDCRPYTTDDVFSRGEAKYRTPRVIVGLANSSGESVTTSASKPAEVDGPLFQVIFLKDNKTPCYTSDMPYAESRSATQLEGLTKAAVESMRVDVR